MTFDPSRFASLLSQLERGFGQTGGTAGAERGEEGRSGLADALSLLGQFQSLDRRDLSEPAAGRGAAGQPRRDVSPERLDALRSQLDGLLGSAGRNRPGGEGG